MQGLQITDVLFKSFPMWLLWITSFVGLAFFIERIMYFSKNRAGKYDLLETVKDKIQKEKVSQILEELNSVKSTPLIRVIKAGLENIKSPKEKLHQIMTNQINKEKMQFEKNVAIIGTISHISPLLGLFGTVIGIIIAFGKISVTGSGGSAVIAGGVALALITTAGGIIIAVPAVIAYNYFVNKISEIVQHLEIVRDEFIVGIR